MAVDELVEDALGLVVDASTAWVTTTFLSDDHAEAVTSFLEKRPPRFTGR